MKSAPRHHTIITGTGRAGTTLLVSILSRLGLPTGFDPENLRVNQIADAGLEHNLREPSCPYIVKSPGVARRIARIFDRNEIVFDHAIICMRNLAEAAESRRAVRAMRLERGLHPQGAGALWGTTDPNQQENMLGQFFHSLIFHLTAHEVPITFIHFPRFAHEPAYLYRKLAPIFPTITEEALHLACDSEIVHDKIHDYSAAEPTGLDIDNIRRSHKAQAGHGHHTVKTS